MVRIIAFFSMDPGIMNIMVFFSVSIRYTAYYGLLLSEYEIY